MLIAISMPMVAFLMLMPTTVIASSPGLQGLAMVHLIPAEGDMYVADNVRMNNVLPGFIDSLPEKEEHRARVPMERYGTTEEIASVISFLASAGAGYIAGQNIRVDGGITRSV